MLKNVLLLVIFLPAYTLLAQDAKPAFDGHAWQAPYSLSMDGWGIERFLIPIEFAPGIKYSGIEDVRFTKGWGEATSNEYWSYAFLWYLDGKPVINERDVEKNLAMYYDGLIGRNVEPRKIPADLVKPTKVTVKKIATHKGDLSTFSGTIDMLDYMQQKPVTLNCIVHQKLCDGQNKTFVFHEISLRPLTDSVWTALNTLWTDFDCKPKAVR
ncbi:hypothetical protein [Flavitalea sp.]|nr:hypothetical protein [Flavitalea sp.]